MNKLPIILLFVLGSTLLLSAQSSEKVKGNRDVTMKQYDLNNFNSIVVGENFSIDLVYSRRPSLEIETDDNLHDYIKFEIKDSTLVFRTLKRITSRKKMNISVSYTDELKYIEGMENGEISSQSRLDLKNVDIKASGSSKISLNIKTNGLTFTSLDKSKSNLTINSQSGDFELSDNCKLDVSLNTPDTRFIMHQRADASVEGSSEDIFVKTENNAKFYGPKFTVETCDLLCEMASDVYIDVTQSITVNISGTSSLFLYGSPEITIETFADSAKLQKKEK